jgi:heme exporter protein B
MRGRTCPRDERERAQVASMTFSTILARDLRVAARRRVDALLPIGFFVVAASIFPFGIGPEPATLRAIAPGIVWVCALLAAMLSVGTLFSSDHADGSLDQMLLAAGSALPIGLAKATGHWLVTGLPLTIVAPVLGLLFGMPGDALAALDLALLLGTPVLSLLGTLGAALTLGVRSGGVLLILIVLPLSVPVLIFGSGSAVAIDSGLSAHGHFSLLGALLILTALIAPPATAAALRIATE